MQNGCKVTKPTEEESSSNDGSEIQNLIANCALDHYGKYITKGKPKDETEWTVYSAVIAQKERQLWVVSAATGTKCTAKRQEGCILHDVHAEVLARRGLVRVLWLELREKLHNMESTNNEKSLLEVVSAKDKRFRLGMNIRLHLYISDSPCGDACIYGTAMGTLFTGAKVIVSSETRINTNACGGDHQLLTGAPVAREDTQLLGKLRSKSGRSNIPSHLRSTSMSCSDKIVRWSILGLQGSLLSRYLEPVLLSKVVVSQDPRGGNETSHDSYVPQIEALERAIPHRVTAVWDYVGSTMENHEANSRWNWCQQIPSVHITSSLFPSSKSLIAPTLGCRSSKNNQQGADEAQPKKRKRNSELKISPCGFAVNYQQSRPNSIEIVVGIRGICQGKKPKTPEDFKKLSSRLSRTSIYKNAQEIVLSDKASYQRIKDEGCDERWKALKNIVFQGGPLSGWLRDRHDFFVEF